MGVEATRTAITTWWSTAFPAAVTAAGLGSVPVLWPAEKRSLPPSDPFVRLSFQSILSRRNDIGTAAYIEDVEQVVVEVFVRDGRGDLLLDQLVDLVRGLFVTVSATPATVGNAFFGDISSRAPREVSRGPDAEVGTLLKAIVVAPYRIEHLAA